MRRAISMVALLLAVGLAIAGCGSGSDKNSSASSSTTTSTSTTSTGPPPGAPSGAARYGPGGPPGAAPGRQPTHGIGALALRRGELPGFTAQGGVSTATTGIAFARVEGIPAGRLKKEAARLARAGFVAGAIEHLASSSGAEGLSVADRFRTSKSARAETAFAATAPPGVKQTSFTVPGIPGARGFDASSAQSSGHNIAFSVGSYYYLVGVGWPTGFQQPPSRARLVSAAQRLYKRVQG